MRHQTFTREQVRLELRMVLQSGRQRIINLGGDCDTLSRMLRDSMHMLDARADQETRHALLANKDPSHGE